MKPRLSVKFLKLIKLVFLPAVYILMLHVMFIPLFFSVDEYYIEKCDASHLSVQVTLNERVMNIIIALLGMTTIIDGWIRLSKYWLHKVVLTILGISLVLTALFQQAPIASDIEFNVFENDLHSKFATITGFSFTFFTLSMAFIEPAKRHRIIAVGTGIIAIFLSMLIFNVAILTGFRLRTMFIIMFA